jgi:hypothetical protein
VAAVESFAILDTPREEEFDDIVRLAAETFDAPTALVDGQWREGCSAMLTMRCRFE